MASELQKQTFLVKLQIFIEHESDKDIKMSLFLCHPFNFVCGSITCLHMYTDFN